MRRLLPLAVVRHLGRHPWQAGLAVLGIALGVAVAVSVDLANASAVRGFELSTTTLAGRATHAVETDGPGLPDGLVARIAREPGVGPAAPVVEGYGTARPVEAEARDRARDAAHRDGDGGGEPGLTLKVLGVDPFAEGPFRPGLTAPGEPGTAAGSARGTGGEDGTAAGATELVTRPGTGLLTRATARELGVEPGLGFVLEVAGRSHEVELLGVLDPADDASRESLAGVLVTDVATAQELLDRVGRVDRIELILPEGAVGSRAEERLRGLLPPDARLAPAGARARTWAEMTRAFRLNLTALSLLALVCGAFLIYNTMAFSVVQRRRLLATLRALGATRRELFAVLLGEAAVVGVAGTLLGLVAGVGLGRLLLELVTRTINDLYFVLTVRSLALEPAVLLRGSVLGVGATLVAALAPAAEATTAPPRAALARSTLESRARRGAPRAASAGLVLLAAGGLLLLAGDGGAGGGTGPSSLGPAFAGIFLGLVGCGLLTPAATVLLMRVFRRPAGLAFGVLGRMAARGVVASLSRTGVAVAALMIAVAVTVGVGVMIGSFRGTVVRWLDATLQADVYLSPVGPDSGPGTARVAPEALRRIRATPGVARLEPLRTVEAAWRPEPETGTAPGEAEGVRLVALDLGPAPPGEHPARERFRLEAGRREPAFDAATRGEAVLVSEPLAYRRGLGLGDRLRLLAPTGERTFSVAGVYEDYGAGPGAVLIHLPVYRELFRDPAISAVSVEAAAGTDPEELAARLRRSTAGAQALSIRSNAALRHVSLAVFDRTFQVTRALRWLAGLVAFIGILSALMALQLERARELGVLRAQGMTPGQLWRLVTSETGLMGLAAGVLAMPVGLALAAVMIFVVNRRSFGWTLDVTADPAVLGSILGGGLALAVGAALLAGIYPAWRMARTPPAEALREE